VTATTAPGPTAPTRSTTPLAWVVALLLAAGLVAIVVLASFSQSNTPSSINGTTATTSHWVK
jgi:hypothetical protein